MNDKSIDERLQGLFDHVIPTEVRADVERRISALLAEPHAAGGRLSERGPQKRPILVLGLTAAALFVAAAVVTGRVLTSEPEAPGDLQDAITSLFAGTECVTADQAQSSVAAELNRLGYAEWSVEPRSGATGERCVIAALAVSERQVVLIPVSGAEVSRAMEAVRRELMESCLDRGQATQLIDSILTGLGETRWSVRTDGPLAYPSDQQEAVRRHVAAGCSVYAGSGHDTDGNPVHYISGP